VPTALERLIVFPPKERLSEPREPRQRCVIKGSSSFFGFFLNLVAPSFVSRHLQRYDKNWGKDLDLIDF
jgi:hypothetical protein